MWFNFTVHNHAFTCNLVMGSTRFHTRINKCFYVLSTVRHSGTLFAKSILHLVTPQQRLSFLYQKEVTRFVYTPAEKFPRRGSAVWVHRSFLFRSVNQALPSSPMSCGAVSGLPTSESFTGTRSTFTGVPCSSEPTWPPLTLSTRSSPLRASWQR